MRSRAASASGRPGGNDGSANARAAADGTARDDGSAISRSVRASGSAPARSPSRAASQLPSSAGGGSGATSTMKVDVTARRVCRACTARCVTGLPNQSTRSRRTAGSGVTASVSSRTRWPAVARGRRCSSWCDVDTAARYMYSVTWRTR
jgi:hypothetical protein